MSSIEFFKFCKHFSIYPVSVLRLLKVLMDEGQGAAGDIEENPNQGFRVLADHSRKAQLRVKV